MSSFFDRVLRVLKLDYHVYGEVETDLSATFQAILVVIISSMAGGFGSIYKFGITGIFTGFVMSLAGWMVWICLVYLIGTKIVPAAETQSNPVQLLRTAGFARITPSASSTGEVRSPLNDSESSWFCCRNGVCTTSIT